MPEIIPRRSGSRGATGLECTGLAGVRWPSSAMQATVDLPLARQSEPGLDRLQTPHCLDMEQ
jgi:hypothetical protein